MISLLYIYIFSCCASVYELWTQNSNEKDKYTCFVTIWSIELKFEIQISLICWDYEFFPFYKYGIWINFFFIFYLQYKYYKKYMFKYYKKYMFNLNMIKLLIKPFKWHFIKKYSIYSAFFLQMLFVHPELLISCSTTRFLNIYMKVV
jgi:hypothetical protein